jgi:glyoxylase-like metal-dependent hydrolase (beta-lactamase superfamily II)
MSVLQVGDLSVVGLSDGVMPVHPTVVFPDTPVDYWDRYLSRFPESFIELARDGPRQRYFNVNVGAFLIRSGRHSVMCDTGLGAGAEMLGFRGKEELLRDMESKGVDRESVTTVFLTHLHADHVGWNVTRRDGRAEPTFPNARYRFGAKDWEHFTSAGMMAGDDGPTTRERVVPLMEQGLIDLLDDETNLAPGVTAIPTPGHTPGHMSLLLSSRNQRAVVLGDLVGSPMQITDSALPYAGDTDVEMGRATRERVLELAEREGQTVLGPHLPKPGWGTLVRFEGRRYFKPA